MFELKHQSDFAVTPPPSHPSGTSHKPDRAKRSYTNQQTVEEGLGWANRVDQAGQQGIGPKEYVWTEHIFYDEMKRNRVNNELISSHSISYPDIGRGKNKERYWNGFHSIPCYPILNNSNNEAWYHSILFRSITLISMNPNIVQQLVFFIYKFVPGV